MVNHKDYIFETIQLTPDYEGKVIATFIQSRFNKGNRKSVLYLHGYTDYFFHDHVCKKFISNHFDFYALDLRKYGRSLLPHQHPNYSRNLNEYFEEINFAIRQIKKNNKEHIYLIGHSTGGLISTIYMKHGKERSHINGLILNSPFFDFNFNSVEKLVLFSISNFMLNISPYAHLKNYIPIAYIKSLHKKYYGEWDFNLTWRPVNGFPLYFAWIHAAKLAIEELDSIYLKIPTLILHSSQSSRKFITYNDKSKQQDIILNVEDIKRVGKTLGEKVTLIEIKNAVHDIFLSEKEVRDNAFDEIFNWIERNFT